LAWSWTCVIARRIAAIAKLPELLQKKERPHGNEPLMAQSVCA
jgi:hypothetical protein